MDADDIERSEDDACCSERLQLLEFQEGQYHHDQYIEDEEYEIELPVEVEYHMMEHEDDQHRTDDQVGDAVLDEDQQWNEIKAEDHIIHMDGYHQQQYGQGGHQQRLKDVRIDESAVFQVLETVEQIYAGDGD